MYLPQLKDHLHKANRRSRAGTSGSRAARTHRSRGRWRLRWRCSSASRRGLQAARRWRAAGFRLLAGASASSQSAARGRRGHRRPPHRREHKGMVLRLRKTKTGTNQEVRVDDSAVITLVRELVKTPNLGNILFPFSLASSAGVSRRGAASGSPRCTSHTLLGTAVRLASGTCSTGLWKTSCSVAVGQALCRTVGTFSPALPCFSRWTHLRCVVELAEDDAQGHRPLPHALAEALSVCGSDPSTKR